MTHDSHRGRAVGKKHREKKKEGGKKTPAWFDKPVRRKEGGVASNALQPGGTLFLLRKRVIGGKEKDHHQPWPKKGGKKTRAG